MREIKRYCSVLAPSDEGEIVRYIDYVNDVAQREQAHAAEVERLKAERDAYNERCDELRKQLAAKDEQIRNLKAEVAECYPEDLDSSCGAECSESTRERLIRLSRRFTAPIVCICGSTKFKQAWISENARLTGLGNIVLSVGLWGHHERIEPDEETKKRLDDLHKRKIDLCDWVWVLDVGGYIGSSTKSEIEYAKAHGKPVRFLSLEFPNYTEPVDPIKAKDEEIAAMKADAEKERKRRCQSAVDRLHNLCEGLAKCPNCGFDFEDEGDEA